MTTNHHLWLFDIDGVLVHLTANPETDPHLKAYRRDYKEVLGKDVHDEDIKATYGMSEIETYRYILKLYKIEENGRLIENIKAAHLKNFREELQKLDETAPLPGVIDFLEYLTGKNKYKGIVTGNMQEPARLILQNAGLDGYFSFVSSADGKSTRAQIVQRAVEQAKEIGYQFDKIILLGDTTKDIKAGKQAEKELNRRIYTIAVASGSDSMRKLRDEEPDMLVPDLKEYMKIVGKMIEY